MIFFVPSGLSLNLTGLSLNLYILINSNIFNVFSCFNVCSVMYEFIYSCGDMEW